MPLLCRGLLSKGTILFELFSGPHPRPLSLAGSGEGRSAWHAFLIFFKTSGKAFNTSSFENRITRKPQSVKACSRQPSHAFDVAWIPPSISTMTRCSTQQKSTMYLAKGTCRRNLQPVLRIRKSSQIIFSVRVIFFRKFLANRTLRMRGCFTVRRDDSRIATDGILFTGKGKQLPLSQVKRGRGVARSAGVRTQESNI